MTEFNQVWQQDKPLDQVINLIANFPFETSAGKITREALLLYLTKEREYLGTDIKLVVQKYERLDDRNVLCIEKWQSLRQDEEVSRWTF